MIRPFTAFVATHVLLVPLAARVDATLLTFEGLGNGQMINEPFEASPFVDITSSGNNLGAAIFNSDPAGPNAGSADDDLLVDLGNLLILQDSRHPNTMGDFFVHPNDANVGGTLTFSFAAPVKLLAIDLVDIDKKGAMTLSLIDGKGLERVYSVPEYWTNEVPTLMGFDTLSLTTLPDQFGEGPSPIPATAFEMTEFNEADVRSLVIAFSGPGAVDNLLFVPEPGNALLVAIGIIGLGLAMVSASYRMEARRAKRR
jgi:hypothetical protein